MAATIEELIRTEGYRYSDFALLYRTNAQSRVFEEILIQKGLPYQVVGGIRFYDRKEIRDLLSYLKLVYNPNDRISLRRVINTPKRGIGEATVERFFRFMAAEGFDTWKPSGGLAEARVNRAGAGGPHRLWPVFRGDLGFTGDAVDLPSNAGGLGKIRLPGQFTPGRDGGSREPDGKPERISLHHHWRLKGRVTTKRWAPSLRPLP